VGKVLLVTFEISKLVEWNVSRPSMAEHEPPFARLASIDQHDQHSRIISESPTYMYTVFHGDSPPGPHCYFFFYYQIFFLKGDEDT
jgi:hypothetical protein